jgi:hypothetical protein
MNYNEDDFEEGMEMEGDDRLFDMPGILQDSDSSIAVEFTTHVNLNRMILETAMRLLERSFWWRFRSKASKMKVLQETYQQMHGLLVSDLTEEEDEIDVELAALEEQEEEDDDV